MSEHVRKYGPALGVAMAIIAASGLYWLTADSAPTQAASAGGATARRVATNTPTERPVRPDRTRADTDDGSSRPQTRPAEDDEYERRDKKRPENKPKPKKVPPPA